MLLAVIGVYGVVAYATTQRTREIGIRVALGATRGDIVSLVLRAGLGWALAGIALGLAGAFAVTRTMAALLFGIAPTDAVTFAGTAVLVAGVALAASYAPARRAAAVNPVVALRSE
jgi:putative ABC transport system permease protein